MTNNTITSQILKRGLSGGTGFLALLATLATLPLASGCAQDPLCPELGSCGGPIPVGQWVLSPGHGSCSEQLYLPETDPRLLGGEIQPARVQSIEPALYDWCDRLIAGAGNSIELEPPAFLYQGKPFGTGNVKYTPDDPMHPEKGTFSAGLTRTGTYALDFPAACMRAFGATDKADPTIDPAGGTVSVCKQLEVPLRADGLGAGAYFNVTCDPNNGQQAAAGIPADPAGCVCLYDLNATGGPAGRYEVVDSHTIVHLLSGGFPTKATYCNKGTSLQLTGADGAYLFGQRGLRTLDLSKAP
jgi:hypothetical protein